ncbi:MAG: SRPBCC domain-containing protein [Bauldia sp.]
MNAATAARAGETPDHQIVIPPGAKHFEVVRTFNAPRDLVFECYTQPKHMVQFWGPHGGTVPECRIDLRVGGVWRVVMRFPNGSEFGYSSVYTKIEAPKYLAWRNAPDDWKFGLDGLPPVELVSTLELEDLGDNRSRMKLTVTFLSTAARDEAIQRGFTGMVTQGNERLDAYLKTLG